MLTLFLYRRHIALALFSADFTPCDHCRYLLALMCRNQTLLALLSLINAGLVHHLFCDGGVTQATVHIYFVFAMYSTRSHSTRPVCSKCWFIGTKQVRDSLVFTQRQASCFLSTLSVIHWGFLSRITSQGHNASI